MVGGSEAAERREDVECPGLEIVSGKDHGPLAFEVVRQARHPREDLERRHIDVRQRSSPARYQVFYLIFQRGPSVFRSRNLP